MSKIAKETQKLSPQKSTTLDDVAARAGVSRMAASVVLNGSRSGTRVSDATRLQILEVAKDLCYRPNLVARSLARRATHIFGFYSGFDYLDVRNPFIGEITAGLLEHCSRHDRDLLLHSIFSGQDIKKLHDELLGGKIDGLVVWAPRDDPLASLLRDARLPVVSIVESIKPFPSVVVDDFSGGFQMGCYLFEAGHRSVLYVSQKRPSDSRSRREAGIVQAARTTGMKVQILADPTPQELLATTVQPSSSRPTAIACWNDMVAHQALSGFRKAGIRIPLELAVTGFDGIQSPIEPDVRLTTVQAPWAEVAHTAINHLLALIEGKEVATETVLPVAVIRGDTA